MLRLPDCASAWQETCQRRHNVTPSRATVDEEEQPERQHTVRVINAEVRPTVDPDGSDAGPDNDPAIASSTGSPAWTPIVPTAVGSPSPSSPAGDAAHSPLKVNLKPLSSNNLLNDLATAQLEDEDLRDLLSRRQETDQQPNIEEMLTT